MSSRLTCFLLILTSLMVGGLVLGQTWHEVKNKECVEYPSTHTGDDVSTCSPPPECAGNCYYILGYKGECSREKPGNPCQWSRQLVWGQEYRGYCFQQSAGERLTQCKCSDGEPTGRVRWGWTTVCQEFPA